MKCHEARSWMSPYLDSELGQTKTYEISEHLQRCEGCAHRFEAESRADEMIRDRIEQERMPEALWASVTQVVATPQRTFWRPWGPGLAMAAVLAITVFGWVMVQSQRHPSAAPQIVRAFVSITPDNAPFSASGDRTLLARQVNATLRREFGIEIPVPTPEQLAPHVGFELVSATMRTDASGHEWVEVRLNCCGQPLLVAFAKDDDRSLPAVFDGIKTGVDGESTYDGVLVASRGVGGGRAVVASRHPVARFLNYVKVVGA